MILAIEKENNLEFHIFEISTLINLLGVSFYFFDLVGISMSCYVIYVVVWFEIFDILYYIWLKILKNLKIMIHHNCFIKYFFMEFHESGKKISPFPNKEDWKNVFKSLC